MPQESDVVEAEAENQSTAHLVHAILQFMRAVRYRKSVVIVSLAASTLLGGLYYATATRYYGAKAAMLIMQTGADKLTASMTGDEAPQRSMMPTFENMIRSAKVLEGALRTLRPEDRIDLGGASKEQCVAILQGKMQAKAIRSTNILELNYASKDPRVAVNVVNAIVQSYLEFMTKMYKNTAGEVSGILTKERGELAEKLSRKQEELLEARRDCADMGFRAESKSLHPLVQRAVYFNDALIAVQKERMGLQALVATIRAALRNGEDLGQHIMAAAEIVGRELVLSSLGLGARDAATEAGMEQALLQNRAELSAMLNHLGPAHPEVVAMQERVRLAEEYLRGSQDRINQRMAELPNTQLGPRLVRMVEQKLDEVRQKEAMLSASFDEARSQAIDLSGKLARLELLEHDVKRLSDLNDVLLNQIASLDLKQNGQEVRVAVTQEPVVVETPISPRLSRVGLLVLAAGLGIGLAGVYLRELLDDRFRSIDELQRQLGTSVLALIRQMKLPDTHGLEALQMHAAPTATESEAFRTLRTALALAHQEARQIVVTSAEPGDGKTTVLANLAVCYAQSEKKTLLIDADMRRPGLTALMDMRGPTGLSSLLRAEQDVIALAPTHIRHSGIQGLDVLPSGPRPSNPAELLCSLRFSQLLAWAETVYDQILIDSPPTLATSDTAIIGRLVDGVMLVVQPDKNRRRLVIRTVASLSLVKIPLLGVIINRVGSDQDRGYYGYKGGYGDGYGYGYGGHQDGYGDTPEYGDEEDDAEAVPVAPAAGSSEEVGSEGRPRRHGQGQSPQMVPRKVA
ncbi:MAG: polysaccharide biosynthesis tyrosine autokinase [Pirellulales bacterium]